MDMPDDIPERALAWHREGRGAALATVIETWGSAPRRPSIASKALAERRGPSSICIVQRKHIDCTRDAHGLHIARSRPASPRAGGD